jgi:hypothetical protein
MAIASSGPRAVGGQQQATPAAGGVIAFVEGVLARRRSGFPAERVITCGGCAQDVWAKRRVCARACLRRKASLTRARRARILDATPRSPCSWRSRIRGRVHTARALNMCVPVRLDRHCPRGGATPIRVGPRPPGVAADHVYGVELLSASLLRARSSSDCSAPAEREMSTSPSRSMARWAVPPTRMRRKPSTTVGRLVA